MNKYQWLDGVTHIGLLVLYGAALAVGFSAWRNSFSVARTRSAATICLVAAAWIIFYGAVSDPWPFRTLLSPGVLWSRAFHYVTASGLISIALLIRDSDAITAALTNRDGEA